jgi:phosphoglycerate kinase
VAKLTVRDVCLKDKRCFVRVDYNVPMKGNELTDDTRIRASLPTIQYLIDQGAKVILASHLGRPGGKVVEDLRMDAVAKRLGELLGRPVSKLEDCVGPEVEAFVAGMKPKDVALLENVRFYPGEEKNDPELARKMASLADLYVNDAFGTAHRAHASTAGIAAFIPAYAGLLMEKEVDALGKLLEDPERPFIAVIGGAKVSDKLNVLRNLLDKVDALLIGGGMANTFLLAMGHSVGKSLAEPAMTGSAREILDKAATLRKTLLLPQDVVVAPAAEPGVPVQVVSAASIPDDQAALDIGPETRKSFSAAIASSKTVFWNGPMGKFEVEPFNRGTMEIAAALARVTGLTVIGGGDSLAAAEMAGVSEKITHLSTGGGASLELLEGKTLPGVACLKDK